MGVTDTSIAFEVYLFEEPEEVYFNVLLCKVENWKICRNVVINGLLFYYR